MTEAEWLKSVAPVQMLMDKRCRDARKRRLVVCACARQILEYLTDPRFAATVEAAEAFADGHQTWDDMKVVRKAATADRQGTGDQPEHVQDAIRAVLAATEKNPADALNGLEAAQFATGAKARPAFNRGCKQEEKRQAALVRNVFGNPFRPVAFSPSWRTDTAVTLARQMYESRDFSAMPILADELQEAGCENPDILSHCRGPGPHVRGCWVVDLLAHGTSGAE